MYIMSPLSGWTSGFEYPEANTALSTVDELDDGVPVALESAPVIVLVPENATVLFDASTP